VATALKKRFLKISGFLIAGLSGFGLLNLIDSAEGAMCFGTGSCAEYDLILNTLTALIFFGIFLMIIGFVLQKEGEHIY
jgi:hypothetical protein